MSGVDARGRPSSPSDLSSVAEDGCRGQLRGPARHRAGTSTADEVAAAVLRCWASLWSDRAVGYRNAARPGHSTGTRWRWWSRRWSRRRPRAHRLHPPPGQRPDDRLLVNAAPGLGEAMVSRHRSRPTRSSSTRRIARSIEFTPGDQPAARALATQAAEPSSRLSAVRASSGAFGAAVDIEAALRRRRLVPPPRPARSPRR